MCLKDVGRRLAVDRHVDDVTGHDVIVPWRHDGTNWRTENSGNRSVRWATSVFTVQGTSGGARRAKITWCHRQAGTRSQCRHWQAGTRSTFRRIRERFPLQQHRGTHSRYRAALSPKGSHCFLTRIYSDMLEITQVCPIIRYYMSATTSVCCAGWSLFRV